MPRSKTRKRKVQSDASRRIPDRRTVRPARPQIAALSRNSRPSGRPPRIPGRGGGR